MSLGVVIVAAGKSRRMGFDKLTHPLGDSFVLQHSVSTFCELEAVTQVCVVTDEERFAKLFPHPKLLRSDGGTERHHSVLNGMKALDCSDYIAVHDGARPLITGCQISRVFENAVEHQAATSAKRISDTLKRGDSEEFVTDSVSRENLWAMETPQIFTSELLHAAYAFISAGHLLVTDEVSAVEAFGHHTKLVPNSSPIPNLKITYPEDIPTAEHWRKSKGS